MVLCQPLLSSLYLYFYNCKNWRLQTNRRYLKCIILDTRSSLIFLNAQFSLVSVFKRVLSAFHIRHWTGIRLTSVKSNRQEERIGVVCVMSEYEYESWWAFNDRFCHFLWVAVFCKTCENKVSTLGVKRSLKKSNI